MPNGDAGTWTTTQGIAFRFLDVALTGALIAGGSEGIHKITQVFTTFLEVTVDITKQQSETATSPANPTPPA